MAHDATRSAMDEGAIELSGRRILRVLFAAQCLSSSGSIMLFTISSILAVKLGGGPQWAGVPLTLQLSGSALAAWPLGLFMDRFGRRSGLNLGQAVGVAGSMLAGIGVWRGSLRLFLAGVLLLGFSRGVADMTRYVAADASHPRRRAGAISSVVFGGTVGSIAGPQLLHLVEGWAAAWKLPALSLPWFTVTGFTLVSAFLVWTFLRPDPSDIAREWVRLIPPPTPPRERRRTEPTGGWEALRRDPRFLLAIVAMLCGHLVMYLTMVLTPVHMSDCHESISDVSWVVFVHVLGMYGFSLPFGRLADRFGHPKAIVAGSAILAVACALGPWGIHPVWLGLVLFLVGIGWNLCYVSGSALLSGILPPGEKGRSQGMVDTGVSVLAGGSCLGSGFLYARSGFAPLLLLALVVSIVPALAVLLRARNTPGTYPSGSAVS